MRRGVAMLSALGVGLSLAVASVTPFRRTVTAQLDGAAQGYYEHARRLGGNQVLVCISPVTKALWTRIWPSPRAVTVGALRVPKNLLSVASE